MSKRPLFRRPHSAGSRGMYLDKLSVCGWGQSDKGELVSLKRWFMRARGWASWVVSPRMFWLTVVLLAVAMYLVWPPATEQRLRWVGTGLQVASLVFALWQIIGTWNLFKLPSPWAVILSFWDRRPRDRVIQLKGIAIGMATGSATMTVWQGMGPELEMAKRFAAIEANLNELSKNVQGYRKEGIEATRKLREEHEAHKRQATTGLADVQRVVRAAQTDGLWPAVVAVILNLCGTLFVGFAPEWGAAPPQDAYSAARVLHCRPASAFLGGEAVICVRRELR